METGIGGGFAHTSELRVMKYKEAISSPDANEWKEEIENEPNRMIKGGVWKAIDRKALPEGAIIITSTWACKKKSNGKL